MRPQNRRHVDPQALSRGLSRFLYVAGAAFVLALLGTLEPVVSGLRPEGSLPEHLRADLHTVRLTFLLTAATLTLLGLWIRRRTLARSRTLVRLVIVSSALALPVFAAELLLQPIVLQRTSIFQPDEELGWELRPGSSDLWGELPVRINASGLRGPDREYRPAPGVRRSLFLGDSVTFGYLIEEDAATIPALVEELLGTRPGVQLECLNSGVGGYSPWQQHAWLCSEGLRYEPDVVVVNFVLNDVTSKLRLRRFGGGGSGFQLDSARAGGPLAFIENSNIAKACRQLYGRLTFGENVQEGAARAEAVSVAMLIDEPDSEAVQAAWELTLGNLAKIVATCRDNDLPLLVVCFPYAAQLAEPGRDSPQARLGAFCAERGVSYLDLLPPLSRHLSERGLPATAILYDALHPNEEGARLCAELVAGALEGREELAGALGLSTR